MTTSGIGRRALMVSAGIGLVAAPALVGAAARAQESAGQAARAALPQVHRFRLGDFTVVVVKDGQNISDNPGATFGTDQPAETVAALLEENFLPVDKFVNGFAPALVDTGSDVVLFDTGFGQNGRANGNGRLIEGLAAAGYQPQDVTVVALTHLHGDHIGGLLENGAPAFPNARYVIGQVEYDFWVSDARVGTPAENGHRAVLANVRPIAEKARFIGENAEVVPGIVASEAFGHSPGHLVFDVESAGRRLVLTADTANHFVLSLQRPDWEVRFDFDKAKAAATRKRVFDRIAADRVAFLGYHIPFPSVGFVEKRETGYRFVPKSYQFDL